MAHLDYKEGFEDLRSRVFDGINQHFPVDGRFQSLELEKLEVDDAALQADDIREQKKAKMEGTTWAAPVFGTLALKDKSTGKVVQRRRVKMADLPMVTRRYSHIVDGQEYQVTNQWQLKPGAYTRRRQSGELETRFNVPNKQSFDITLDPEKKLFMMERGKSKAIPMYPIMKTMGVTDKELEAKWGTDVLEANKAARGTDGALAKFFKADRKKAPTSVQEAEEYLKTTLTQSNLRPDATEVTLGKGFSNVDGDALTRATGKMLQVQQGKVSEDDRDSLVFKDLRGIGDFAYDKLTNYQTTRSIRNKMLRQINTARTIRDVVKFDTFNAPVRSTFSSNSAVEAAPQVNPVEMVASAMKTTIMGPGGIQSAQAVVDEAKLINPSHLGFLDPIHTPESEKTGVTLHLPLGVKKEGRDARVPLYDMKKGKVVYVGAKSFITSNVVMPDQVKWKDGKPQPVNPTVKMAVGDNEITSGKFEDANYVMMHPSQMFSVTSNLIPFMGNNSGNRASYATHHLEQAISLKDREPPLVQVGTGAKRGGLATFEDFLGKNTGHTAPIDGVISKVGRDAIHIKGKDGKEREIQIYDNFPLNDTKSVLHSEPLVKPGDKVVAGQSVADTNYTKGGKLALGTNLNVAYIPYKGYNFEDGVVISEGAAKKLSSVHMHKPMMALDKNTITDPKKFMIQHTESFTKNQYNLLGEDGVVKVGAKVQTGDPLVLGTKPYELKDRTGVGAIRKSASGAHTDVSLRWESDHPGEVVGVHKNKKGELTVHVRTVEPMQIGDKLCYAEDHQILTSKGWKSVEAISLTDEVCSLNPDTEEIEYLLPAELHKYPCVDEPMYMLDTTQVSMFVTLEHKTYAESRGGGGYSLLPVRELQGKRYRLKTSGRWRGEAKEEFVLPSLTVLAGQGGRGTRELEPLVLQMESFLTLLGMYLADGHAFSYADNYGIEITKIKQPDRRDAEEELEACGFHVVDAGDKMRIYGKQLYEYFKQFGRAPDKYIPDWVFQLASDQLLVLYRWLMWGDGCTTGTSHSYSTTSERLADDVQRLLLHIGLAGVVSVRPPSRGEIKGVEYDFRRLYRVGVTYTKLRPTVNHGHAARQAGQTEQVVNYTGNVFCVALPRNHVLYTRRNGKCHWSGNTGRHGNKGIVTQILSDKEMPKLKNGGTIDVALNPAGIPGRMNIGQVLETVASKIAKKTGSPYIVENFAQVDDQLAKVKADLAKHGLSDTEELVDPKTGKSLGKALVGHQHMLKLTHQIDKKLSVRSGMNISGAPPESYDTNLMPARGGKAGGQAIGNLGMYVMLAHGAKANIREMQTWKSEGPDNAPEGKQWKSQHDEVWRAIQNGDPLPPPKSTFAFQKFTDMLRVAGVNVEKKGNRMQLTPLTDEQTLAMSNGEVQKPSALTYPTLDKKTGEPKPIKGGLFDEKVTGGHGGKKWSHFTLAEPMPNPVFEGAVQKVLGLTRTDYTSIIEGGRAVDKRTGALVPLDTAGSIAGGPAIVHMLGKLDVDKELKSAQSELDQVKVDPAKLIKGDNTQKLDKAYKRVKYLQSLKELGMSPTEAYTVKHVPVIPPAMRPASVLPDGAIKWADLNGLYKDLGSLNEQMVAPAQRYLDDTTKKGSRAAMYDGLKALTGVGVSQADRDGKNKGVLLQIAGTTPKQGYFQKTLLSRRQDLSMRSTIVPEPAMGIDQVGLPTEKAMTLFRPFLIKKMVDIGVAPTALDAGKALEQKGSYKDKQIQKALDLVMEERPILLKRDPALHRHSIQAFNAFRAPGKAIQIHPLVTGGYNADFDGNCFVGSTKVVLMLDDIEYTSPVEVEAALREIGMHFSEDTLVFVYDGKAAVECRLDEIPFVASTKRLDKNGAAVFDVPTKMSVLSYDHVSGKPVFEPFTYVTVEENCDVAKVVTKHGFEVTASTNESLCIYDHETGDIRRVSCTKEYEGKLSPVVRHLPGLSNGGDFMTGWMYGAFASDGFITGESIVGYSKVSDAHRSSFIEGLRRHLGHFQVRTYTTYHEEEIEGESTKINCKLTKEQVAKFQDSFYAATGPEGRSCLRKKLPNLGSLGRQTLIGMLCGLLDVDGTLSISNAKAKPQVLASFSTSSPTLVKSVVELGLRLGVRVGVTRSEPKAGSLQKNTAYVLTFSTVDLASFAGSMQVFGDSTKQALQLLQDSGPTKDDRDIVPVPISVMSLLASKARWGEHELYHVWSVTKSKRKVGWYVSRAAALRAVEFLQERLSCKEQKDIGLGRWLTLLKSSVHWDVIDSIQESGKAIVYDLCVPRTKIFAVNGGLVVWDTMSAYVPIASEAVEEARKMFPSNNLFNEATGRIAHAPSLESALGLYKLSRITGEGKTRYADPTAALKAVEAGKLPMTQMVQVGGIGKTTAGRIMLSAALPEPLQKKVLTDPNFLLNKKGVNSLYTDLAKNHRGDYGGIANRLKDLGFDASYGLVRAPNPDVKGPDAIKAAEGSMVKTLPMGTHTLSLDDLAADTTTRDLVVKQTQKKVDVINSMDLPKSVKNQRAVEAWEKATKQIMQEHLKGAEKKGNNLFQMLAAGTKPSLAQYQQIKLAPMLVEDAAGRVLPTPVTKSYSEGLDVAGYWTQMSGARKGSVKKVQEVQEPGEFSKQLINTTMNLVVNGDDCKTQRGIGIGVMSDDIYDRRLATDVAAKGRTFAAGTMLTPDVVAQLRAADKNALVAVRSPLKCEHAKGLCQKCAGLSSEGKPHTLGTNLGILSAQSLGERSVQLSLKAFHSGGVAGVGGTTLGMFGRIKQLTEMPRNIPDAAKLAMTSGVVDRVDTGKLGTDVVISGKSHFVPLDRAGRPLTSPLIYAAGVKEVKWAPPKVGQHMQRGDLLSDPNRTFVNMHDLYRATGNMEKVQNHLVNELHSLYKEEGVRREHVETVVKGMSNLTRVRDPGQAVGILKGEFQPTSVVAATNRRLVAEGKSPIKHTPILKGVNVMPLTVQEDWMAKMNFNRLRESVVDGAATGAYSNLHGENPIPGMVYGAEFGMTSQHARLKPHLANVPKFGY